MTNKQPFLEKCRKLIEEKLGWGDAAEWQNQDFENLGDRIFEVTGVVLSASTLKRIWGKVQYNSKPNLSTLDALARFAGFDSWRTFTASEISRQPAPEMSAPPLKKRRPFKIALLVLALAGASLFIGSIFVHKPGSLLTFGQLRFSSKPVTLGVPNTVIFEYDATHSNADSVFIQQSWDPKRRFRVDKNRHTYTSTYYMPGVYKAKLILNDSIVKEHDLIIESGGWMGALRQEPAPLYVTDRLQHIPGQTGIGQQDLDNLNLEQDKAAPVLMLANVNRNFNISSNHFLLSLDLQNTYKGNNAPCLQTNILVLGTDGYLLIPLGKPGCAGELNMMLGEKPIEGRTNDLSAFGVDFAKPVPFQCEVRNQHIQIMVNGKAAYTGRFEKDIGQIVGIQVNFSGIGFIRNFQLKAAG
ncbi:MAG: hypothetical protein J7599_02840 [Niabella sp.]|nr:hypothetical protein [Niabella sp.]